MSDSITSGRHNDFVGDEASRGRIPGADKATTGHHFVAVDLPRDQTHHTHARRAEEHLPPPTGRDAPPAGVAPGTHPAVQKNLPSDILRQHEAVPRRPSPVHQVDRNISPLPPAPGSHTVIDTDPYAAPTSVGDTLGGVTSKDVYGGFGCPGSGMSSAEMHHDGQAHRKRHMQGKDQYGTGDTLMQIGVEGELPDEMHKRGAVRERRMST